MIYPKIPLAQSIIQICLAKGVTNIVISPGSRNAPLTIGFTANPAFTCYSIADERCAAFFAMGIAQQIRKPVAVVCTSGSALLNYYPAVAEAFYSQIPLIVISADRPHDKIDIGDGQTIRQENVYANHILYNASLTEKACAQNDTEIISAIDISLSQKGPVHINVPFEEPLYEVTEELLVNPVIPDIAIPDNSNKEYLGHHLPIWNRARKKMVLVGVNNPGEISPEVIEMLATDPSVIVFTETPSNIHHERFTDNIDAVITPFTDEDFKQWQPDILLTFGGMVVSKRIKAFLRKYPPAEHWHVDTLRAYDTFNMLTKHFVCEPDTFLKEFLPKTTVIDSDYNNNLQLLKAERIIKHKEYLSKIPFSDLKAFEILLKQLPDNSQLHISNSASIRYAQLFEINKTIDVFCNRGTSGIDGCTSTAIGAAVGNNKQTTLITGDISFFYDSNALWNNYVPGNFKIIIINNGGGGIFRILPGHAETPVFNTYFETAHHLTAEHLAKMYGFGYQIASNEDQLATALPDFYTNNSKPSILEVFTPMMENDKILLQYFRELV